MPISTDLSSTFDDLKRKYPDLEGASDEELSDAAKYEYPNAATSSRTSANTSPQFLNSFQEWFDYGIYENSYGWICVSSTKNL